jgi:hypothetical protein
MITIHFWICALLLGCQNIQGFIRKSPQSEGMLIVVGAASSQERNSAESILKYALEAPGQIEMRAQTLGYKVISKEGVLYLLPPRCWRDNTPVGLSQLAELLTTVPPRSPYSTSQISPLSRTLLSRWLVSQSNPSKPREPAIVERLLNNGYLWWSGLIVFEVDANGQRYSGSVFLDCTPAAPPHHFSKEDLSSTTPPKPKAVLAEPENVLEETLLFSQAVPAYARAKLAKTYFELVAREYQIGHERYQELILQLQKVLLNHFGLPGEWSEGKESFFSTLPEWVKDKLVAELKGYFRDETVDRIKDMLGGARIKATAQPVILIGGFVNESSFESYGWGLSDLLKIDLSH